MDKSKFLAPHKYVFKELNYKGVEQETLRFVVSIYLKFSSYS